MFIEKETCKISKVRRTGMIFKGDECNRNVFLIMPVLRTSKILRYFPDYKHIAPTALSNVLRITLSAMKKCV
jgi:hypothetical protein